MRLFEISPVGLGLGLGDDGGLVDRESMLCVTSGSCNVACMPAGDGSLTHDTMYDPLSPRLLLLSLLVQLRPHQNVMINDDWNCSQEGRARDWG